MRSAARCCVSHGCGPHCIRMERSCGKVRAREPRVGAQHDLHARPARADLPDDARPCCIEARTRALAPSEAISREANEFGLPEFAHAISNSKWH